MVRCRPLLLVAALAVPGFLAGCSNPCQQLCVEIATYAQQDCGFEVTSDQIEECQDDNSALTEARYRACVDQKDPQTLREWWTCEDLAENFQDAAP